MTAYTPAQAKRLGVHLMNAEPRSALHGSVIPAQPSRLKRILWLICGPLFLLMAAMVWGVDAVRWAVS